MFAPPRQGVEQQKNVIKKSHRRNKDVTEAGSLICIRSKALLLPHPPRPFPIQ